MTISDFSHEQKLALVGLMEAVVMANVTVTEGEQQQIGKVADALGDEQYRLLLEEVEKRFTDMDSLKLFLETVQDTDARELIFGTVWEDAMADPAMTELESDLLNWLAETWHIAK